MKRSDELIVEIRAKKKEVENLHKAGETSKAAKVAEELDAICDEYQIQKAKEKSDFDNFLAAKDKGECTLIDPNGGSKSEYYNNFFQGVRTNFQNSGDLLMTDKQGGGYLLPTELNNEIISKLAEQNVMRELATTITTESKHKIPIVSSKPQAQWTREGQQINFSDETFDEIELGACKLTCSIKITNELLADSSYNLEEHFANQFVEAIASAEEEMFITGTPTSDTNVPVGFLTTLENIADSDSVIVTSHASSLDSNPKIIGDDLISLVYTLPRAYRRNASWLMNDATLQYIRKIKTTEGQFLWTDSLREGEPPQLLGYPVFTSSYFPAASVAGDTFAAFGDFHKYFIADRSTRLFKPLRELYAMSDCTAFLMIERVDGRLVDTNAIKLLKLV